MRINVVIAASYFLVAGLVILLLGFSNLQVTEQNTDTKLSRVTGMNVKTETALETQKKTENVSVNITKEILDSYVRNSDALFLVYISIIIFFVFLGASVFIFLISKSYKNFKRKN